MYPYESSRRDFNIALEPFSFAIVKSRLFRLQSERKEVVEKKEENNHIADERY
jgi:hypothetical protein